MNREELLILVHELEKAFSVGFFLPPFGKFVSGKELEETIQLLRQATSGELLKRVEEIEAIVQFSFLVPGYGKVVSERGLRPKINDLRTIICYMEENKLKENTMKIELIKDEVYDEINETQETYTN